MKQLLLIRHAKSSWKDPSLADHDRPLNKRGQRDLPRMYQRLLQRQIRMDACWSSTALRAKTTAEALCPAITSSVVNSSVITSRSNTTPNTEKSTARVQLRKELYTFDPAELAKQICNADPSIHSLAIVGHNPALALLIAELLIEELLVDEVSVSGHSIEKNSELVLNHFPTCAMALLELDIENWSELHSQCAKLIFYDWPKRIKIQ